MHFCKQVQVNINLADVDEIHQVEAFDSSTNHLQSQLVQACNTCDSDKPFDICQVQGD